MMHESQIKDEHYDYWIQDLWGCQYDIKSTEDIASEYAIRSKIVLKYRM